MVLLLDSEGGKKKPVPSSGLGKSSTGSPYGKSKAAVAGETGSASGTKTVVEEDNGPPKELSNKGEYRKQRAEDNRRRNSILPNPYTCLDFGKEWSDEDAVEYGNWLRFERAYRRHLTHAEMDYLAANPRVTH
ncbi:unnamed protein product [Arabidopsis lyrata]|nr:unnamed protein product [Arabidopsis lyrata]